MATAKTRTTKARAAPKSKVADDLLSRTARTVTQKPYVTAAIATGAVTAVAAVAAGAFFFSRKDKSFGEFTARIKHGFVDANDKIRDRFAKDKPPQSEIAEEALTLKETGKHGDQSVADLPKVAVVTH